MAAGSMIFLYDRLDTPSVAMNKNRVELKILFAVTSISISPHVIFLHEYRVEDAPRGSL